MHYWAFPFSKDSLIWDHNWVAITVGIDKTTYEFPTIIVLAWVRYSESEEDFLS